MIAEQDVIQTEVGDTLRFTQASHPPASVFVPIEHDFTVEECGNYRKIRFKTDLVEGEEGAEGVEVIISNGVRKVFTLDVKTPMHQILRMKRDPSYVCVHWVDEWKEPRPGVFERTLLAWGQLEHLTAIVEEEDIKYRAQDVQNIVTEHLRGTAKSALLVKVTEFDALVPSENEETRVHVNVTVENI